ncbi:MAG: TIGR03016 family PEP-CTERM system-associated outer membrane protein [Pseudomonadota bacterium]
MHVGAPGAIGRQLLKRAVPAIALALSGVAHAQRWTVDTSVTAQATVTDNSAFEESRLEGPNDVVLTVAPSATFRREGARLRASGTVGLSAAHYVDGTQAGRLVPAGNVGATLEAIERSFFIDATAVVTQTRSNPFAPRAAGVPSADRLQTAQARISPYLQGNPSPNLRYLVRSDNSWTETRAREGAAGELNGYVGRHFAEIERLPRPWGFALQAEHTATRFTDTTQGTLTLDIARVRTDYAFGPELVLGLRAGYERNNYVLGDKGNRSIYGAEAMWRPTERTDLNAHWERRFFGSGWRASFAHRRPRIAFSALLSRDVGSAPQSLFTLAPTDDVAALMDAAFTTRVPDPVERARLVQDVIARQGLPTSLGAPVTIYTQRISLISSRSASVVLLGARSSIAFTAFDLRTEDLPDTVFAVFSTAAENNIQRGGAVTYSHQMTPLTSLNATYGYTRTRALRAIAPDASDQHALRVQTQHRFGTRTFGFLGARYQLFNSSTTSDAREKAAFAGLTHRF